MYLYFAYCLTNITILLLNDCNLIFLCRKGAKKKGFQRQQSVVRVTTHQQEYPKTPFAQKMYEITSYISSNRLEIFWGTLFTLVLIGIFLERAFCMYFLNMNSHIFSQEVTDKPIIKTIIRSLWKLAFIEDRHHHFSDDFILKQTILCIFHVPFFFFFLTYFVRNFTVI